MHRHVLRPAAWAGMLAASAAAVLTAVLVSPAGAAPGHPAGAAPVRPAGAGEGRHGRWLVPYREFGPPGRPVPAGTPVHTLIVKATNLAGKPDTGGVMQLFNIDGLSLPPLAKKFEHGVATFSVPAGHYFGLASFPATTPTSLHTVVLPQVNVTRNTTVTVAETSASSKLTMVTPRPATVIDSDVWFQRTGASGAPITLEGYFTSGEPLWFSPTKVKPTVGTLQMSVNQHLESPPGPGVPYEYTLSFTSPPGLIPPQRHVVTASGLATVTERFYQPFASRAGWDLNGEFPAPNPNTSWFGFIEPDGPGMKLPGELTEYAGGGGTARFEWDGHYYLPYAIGIAPGEVSRQLRPGEQMTDNWSAYPLHTAANVELTPEAKMFGDPLPSAARAGNLLRLEVDPFDDSTPGHVIGVVNPRGSTAMTGTYQIDQNGIKIAGGDAVKRWQASPGDEFYAQAKLSPAPSTITFSLDMTRANKDFPLSTATSTVWTWHSAPQTGATLPPGWTCVSYTHDRACAIQPMMTLGYAVAGLRLNGSAKPGPQVLHLTAGHLQAATASKVTKVSESVSFDDGKTWHAAKVTGSGGSYAAAFTAPARVKVSLRTSAADAAGGSVAETITSAYQIGS